MKPCAKERRTLVAFIRNLITVFIFQAELTKGCDTAKEFHVALREQRPRDFPIDRCQRLLGHPVILIQPEPPSLKLNATG